jgi:hypothetical protein
MTASENQNRERYPRVVLSSSKATHEKAPRTA